VSFQAASTSTFQGLAPGAGEQLWKCLLGIVWRVEELPCPTMFASHALCLTAAFELNLACDLLLAAESAKFGLVETVVGLTPSMGGPQRLAERAGPARARQLIYTGGLFDAATLCLRTAPRVAPSLPQLERGHHHSLNRPDDAGQRRRDHMPACRTTDADAGRELRDENWCDAIVSRSTVGRG
jgi:hypothetical protein